jgi:hypothetical protein
MTRPLAYAAVDRTTDAATVLRVFGRKDAARRYARRHGVTLCAKYRGHAGLTVVECYAVAS